MNDLRTAAQQALEALELALAPFPLDDIRCQKAADALKAALIEDAMQKFTDVNQELEAALAEPVQEPVPSAWRYKDTARICDNSDKRMTAPPGWVPLYSAPPQRKPLTEEEIYSLFRTVASPVMFARAIERAHGIDGAPEERHFCPRCGKRTRDIHTCTPPGDCDVHG